MADIVARRAFASLVAAACVDGKIADPERTFLLRKARELKLSDAEVDDYLQQGLQGKLTVAVPPTPLGKEALLEELIRIAAADGRVEQAERQLLMRFGTLLGMQPHELGQRVRDSLNVKRNDTPRQPAPEPVREAAREPARERKRSRVDPAPITFRDDAARSKDSPMPIRFDPLAPSAMDNTRENFLAVSPGPIKVAAALVSAIPELSPITLELVKNVIRFDGREAAVDYIVRTCQIPNVVEATRIVDKIVETFEDCRPGSAKLKYAK
jgi:tellurite resistance protein TerB